MNRDQAWELLNEFTKNPALIRHALCVEAAMRHYARIGRSDESQWGIAGLLHDFDYERFQNPPEHTREGAKILRAGGCDEEIIGTILSHVPWNQDDFQRDRPIRKTLFACDELCGFIYAAALVRPDRLNGMQPSSITKKMKDKAFARAVSREDIIKGAQGLGVELDEHISFCIRAMEFSAHILEL